MAKKALISVLFALFVLPFGYLLLLSFAGTWRYPAVLPTEWTWQHWTQLAGSGNWANSAFLSLLLASLVAFLSTVTGFLTAKVLSAHSKRHWWTILAYLPFAFSPVIYAHCLKFFFHYFALSGAFQGVLIAQLFLCYPFAFLFFIHHFDPAMQAMEDLTYTLGGKPKDAFWKVLIPMSKLAILICFFQTFLISWFEYGLSSVIGLGQVRTLTIAVYQYIGESNQFVAALASCLIALPPLFLLWFNQRFVFRQSTV